MTGQAKRRGAAPGVSVVIPTYNRADMLADAIKSVLCQTSPVAEVIVVDDGSGDHTRQVAERYGGVTYIRKENGGVSSARNRGISEAGGEFIAFLDSDDRWLPDKMARELAAFAAHSGLGMVVSDSIYITPDWQICGGTEKKRLLPENGMIFGDVLRNPGLSPSSVMVRRQAAERIGGFDESLKTAEDLDFFIRLSREFEIFVLPEKLSLIMRGNEGLNRYEFSDDDRLGVIEKHVARAGERLSRAEKRACLFDAYCKASRGKLYFGQYAASLRYAARALGLVGGFSDLARLLRQAGQSLYHLAAQQAAVLRRAGRGR